MCSKPYSQQSMKYMVALSETNASVVDEKLIFFGRIVDESSITLIFYRHSHVFSLHDDQQIANEG